MSMKRKSGEEILRIQKRAREKRVREVARREAPALDPPGSLGPHSSPNEAESFTTRIRRETVEEFKGSLEFRDLLDAVGAQSFLEGFYASRRWINYHMPQLDLRSYTFCTVPPNFHYLPHNYLTEAENALAARKEEAWEEEAEEDVVELAVDDEDVEKNQPSEKEKDRSNISTSSFFLHYPHSFA